MKVLIVDDEPDVRALVASALSYAPFESEVLEAGDGEEALEVIRDAAPDLVVLDLAMPTKDGFSVLEELRRVSMLPVIVLTARGLEQDKIRGLELGADDYVAKPFNPAELSARARAVLRRMRSGDGAAPVVRAKDVEIDLDRRLVMRSGELVALTRTEWQLLQSLAEHPGKVLGSVELLTRVWGPEFRDDLQYLRVWISRLRSKLDPQRSEPELIQTFPGIGYMLNGEFVSESNAVDVDA